MLTLDMKTVMYSNVIISFICIIVMLILWYQNRNKYSGLSYWVIDWVLQAGGALLISLRGTVPNWASIVVGNGMVVGGTIILYFGLCRFTGKKNPPQLKYIILSIFAIFLFIHSYFVFINDDLLARSINTSIGLSLACFLCMWLMFKGVNPDIRRISKGTGISFAIIILISIIRIIGFSLLPQTSNDFLKSGMFDALFVLLLVGGIVFLVFNLVLLVNRRLNNESEQANAIIEQSEHKYRSLFENMLNGFAFCKILVDEENRPVDFIYINVNDSFERLTGLKKVDVIGKRVSEAIPGINDTNPELLANYGKVALTGKPTSFEVYLVALGIWLTISVYSPQQDYFVAVFDNITERKLAEEKLKESEEQYRTLFASAAEGILIADMDTKQFSYANPAICKLLGYSHEELLTINVTDIHPQTSRELALAEFDAQSRGEKALTPALPCLKKDGTIIYVDINATKTTINGRPCNVGFFTDVTEPMRFREQRVFALDVLKRLNHGGNQKELIHDIILLIKKFSGFEAVGIRLKVGEDYPYYDSLGFIEGHVQMENHLCAIDESGTLIRDAQGFPILECMCGNILCGRFDPAKPFFTKSGSFWTNCTSELLAITTEEDRQARTRNRCNGEGYESVALIPLKSGSTIIGLLQFNDKRRRCFTPALIKFYEGIGESIGVIIERQQAELALKLSEEKYREVINTSIDAVIAIGPEMKVTVWNQGATRIFGYGEKEMLGQSLMKIVPELYHQKKKKGFSHFINTGSGPIIGKVTEVTGLKMDGTEVPIELSLSSSKIGGKFIATAIVRDITERKQAERALQESRTNFYNIVERTADGIVIVNKQGITLFVNKTLESILHRRADELLGEMFGLPIIDGETTEIDIVLKSGEHGVGELSVVETEWKGEPAYLISLRDITERRKAENELMIKEKAIASSVNAISIADHDGNLTYVNPAFLKMWGFNSDAEVLGMSILEFCPKDDLSQNTIKALYEKKSWQGELVQKRENGVEFFSQLSINPVMDNDDRPIAIMASFIDLTERKRAEEVQKILSQRLQAQVSELEAFSYGIAHDLRSPLVSIEGFSHLLREDIRDLKAENVEEDIRLLESGVKRMQGFLNDTLEYSRSGQMIKRTRDVSISEIIKEVLAALNEQINAIGATVLVAKTFPNIYADSSRIKQVLDNLIQNSIKYRDKTVPLKIEIGHYLSKKETVFFVKDNGLGIDECEVEKVFALYYRGTAEGEGSGIGLTVVKKVIEAHGGRAWVQQGKTEKGTTMCFTLPQQNEIAKEVTCGKN
jgi:PAS domain S-box-containing protein